MVPVGHAFGSIDEMGDGVFRKVRRELGVTAFGVNALVLAPGVDRPAPLPREQDELYFVHRGRARFEVGGETRELGPAACATSSSTTPRRMTSVGDEDLVMLVVGAKDGYVGRDGHPAEPGRVRLTRRLFECVLDPGHSRLEGGRVRDLTTTSTVAPSTWNFGYEPTSTPG